MKPKNGYSQSINGNNNFQINGDININKREISKNNIVPPDNSVNQEQKFKIKEQIDKLVSIEDGMGVKKDDAYKKWWSKFKRKFKITSYSCLPSHLFDDAISFLNQEIAKLRPKLRKIDNQAWRKQYYSAIYARIKELNYDKEYVYEVVSNKLNKKVESITELNDRDLKKLYQIIFSK